MMVNAKLVMRYGMRTLSKWALRFHILAAVIFLLVALPFAGHPPLWTLGAYLFFTFFCSGILFGNYNAMVMDPVGRIAGMAAAISGSLATLVALGIGSWIGQHYDGTILPLVYGFLAMGLSALAFSEWAERARLATTKDPHLAE